VSPGAEAAPAASDASTARPNPATEADASAPLGAPGEWVLIKAGSFEMGSPADEPGRSANEQQRRVTLTRDFWMQATEVTVGQWREVMGANPSRFPECGAECPIHDINWFEAASYCNKLSSLEALPECYRLGGCGERPSGATYCASVGFEGLDCRGYRLPTEAEWEYAARAGTTTAVYAGPLRIVEEERSAVLDRIAWYVGNCTLEDATQPRATKSGRGRGICRPHPVRLKRPNAWGLYDMLGNVGEWCHDWTAPYPASAAIDPAGPETGDYRAMRGGSYVDFVSGVRAAARSSLLRPEYSFDENGMRPVRTKR
jgi:formylglycine-generating enzyme required for sulfatase activity